MNKNVLIAVIVVLIGLGAVVVAVIVRSQTKITESNLILNQTSSGTVTLPTPTTSPLTKMGALENGILLTVDSPKDNAVVNTSSVIVKGKTVAKAEVFVNDKEVVADANGNFSVYMALDEGENPILVVANDADGNAAEVEMTVTYEVKE